MERNVGHGDDRDVTGINCTIDRAIVSSDRWRSWENGDRSYGAIVVLLI
ncbi:MAG: hypothetical protein NT070_16120 [Cyanobacteria bacterium]|nr:hypothetical protein [Cyanobacteriota bacterium]